MKAHATSRTQLWHARQGEILLKVYTQDATAPVAWLRALMCLDDISASLAYLIILYRLKMIQIDRTEYRNGWAVPPCRTLSQHRAIELTDYSACYRQQRLLVETYMPSRTITYCVSTHAADDLCAFGRASTLIQTGIQGIRDHREIATQHVLPRNLT